MREVLAEKPDATVEYIEAVLEARGMPKSINTIRSIRSDFMGCYRALAKAGALKTTDGVP
jgi:hypothetical protein